MNRALMRVRQHRIRVIKRLQFKANLLAMSGVVLPVIRRMMPSIIAQEIIGVQPMNGPFDIFSAKISSR